MTNSDNLKKSIEELKAFWSNSNQYDIKEKAEEYIELYKTGANSDHFTWVHPEDAPYINTDNCKAAQWGIPNQILGDIEKAKFIFGLYNPGTQMKNNEANKTTNVEDYVNKEKEAEQTVNGEHFDFESKEYSGDSNFYLEHVISNENVMSQELKKLYKIFKEDKNLFLIKNDKGKFKDYNSKLIEKVAYYLHAYYSKAFQKISVDNKKSNAVKDAIGYYYNLFEKMKLVKEIVVQNNIDYDVEKEFEKAAENIAICNVEMLPYRSSNSDQVIATDWKLPSGRLAADVIVDKLLKDKNTVTVFRSFELKEGKKKFWKGFLEQSAQQKGVDFKDIIKMPIFWFGGKQSASLSKNNVELYDSSVENPQEKVNEAIDLLLKELKMEDFSNKLDEIIKNN
ncbi:hypothetical protein CD149_07055 [Staphylococcus condimenti]|uniref:Uncharacterized protein n=1 Tax=Staphylococcus condimenti TaxID=70255 RepID=A0AB37H888_9STAP|nr:MULTISPECIES: hypothetical protein [Staphylococcus]AMY05964.1 hypothetical protein A4G25_08500 [Staphylococcus condimenti]APR59827.1 hypothetical protein BTZ13_00780 [Staphylococcus condimenti]MDK8644955.1 hypothetical protein [Staphylococcus condimenti]OFP03001.1 hypothetical protein HMPREF3007_08260 [Staphylococcus sp. HMSC065E08]PNZ60590.1 hypothetical protein CD149_07055 [Staphylococcus condimenti]